MCCAKSRMVSARCDEVRGSKGSRYVGRSRRATCLVASEPPPPQSRYKDTTLSNPFCPQMSSFVRRSPQKSKRLTFFFSHGRGVLWSWWSGVWYSCCCWDSVDTLTHYFQDLSRVPHRRTRYAWGIFRKLCHLCQISLWWSLSYSPTQALHHILLAKIGDLSRLCIINL